MSSRILRDGMRSSEAVAGLQDNTFRLWIHLMLAADDFGLVEIGYGPIRESAPLMNWSREMVAKMLAELIEAELILPYETNRKCYAAISKWKQAVNCIQPKHPVPSFGMGHMQEPYKYKDQKCRNAAQELIKKNKEDTSNRVPRVRNEVVTSGEPVPEDVRCKMEEEPLNPFEGDVVLPDWIPGAEWNLYVRMRDGSKHPMTVDAVKLAVRTLSRFRTEGYDVAEVLEQSVLSKWRGLFRTSYGKKKTPEPAAAPSMFDKLRAEGKL